MSACVCGRIFRVNATSCNLTVLRQETVAEDIMRLTVQWQDRSREPHAGQFYMLRAWAADATPILSRPISVDDFDNQTGALTFLYQVKGEGTHKLAALKKDDTLTVTGPCGNGFDTAALAGQYKRIAVVGGGIGAIASSALGGLGMFRYPLLQVANDGWLPSVFKKTDKNGYPYAIYLLFYVISIFPIVTGRSLDAIVSQVMIPTMLINIYMNLACLTLPKKYPEQWAQRSIKMPLWFYNICCVLGAFCAGVVAFNLFKDRVRYCHRCCDVRAEHPAPETGCCQGRGFGRQERGDRPSGHYRYHC